MVSFGKLEFRLRGETIPESVWVRKKSKIMLAYLLAEPDRFLTKDKMIDEFFQDVPPENADAVYHNTLSNMRNALKIKYDFFDKDDAKARAKSKAAGWEPELLLYEDKVLQWNKDFYCRADCVEFEKFCNSALSSESKKDQKIYWSRKAVELYKGDFLPGYYDSWTEEKRQNYSNMYMKLCFELMSAFKEKRAYSEVIKYAEKALQIDKLNEEAYLNMIEAYSLLGEINTAKDKFSLMLKVFDEEIGEKPEKSILDRIKKLLL
jgi:two-component SAPR family response regulator